MNKFRRLTLQDRYQIQALMASGHSQSEVGRRLGRATSTVSRELGRLGRYDSEDADEHARALRTKVRPEQRKIRLDLRRYVRDKLLDDFSPEQIEGRILALGIHEPVSRMTIYRFIERDRSDQGELYKHLRILRRQRKNRKAPNWRPGAHSIKNKRPIEIRPKIVEKRKRIGDYERDTVWGKRDGPMLLTIVDRCSRLLKLAWIARKDCELVHHATVECLKDEPVITITNDNGPEFARHRETERQLGGKVYFNRPYRSWERGTNENLNGLLRQYFPKKKPIGYWSEREIKIIENKLNNRPRKCLGFKTPHEVHRELKAIMLR